MDRPSMDQGAARTAAELRLQLAQVTAASQMLERTATDESSRKYLAALEQGICRMLRTVGRLELSQRLGGDVEPELQRKPLDLALLSNELGARLKELLAWAEVELTVSTPDYLLAQADEGLIRQLLMELVSNGAKAGSRVTLTLVRQEDRAVFTVEDNGPGIPPERLGCLFSSAEEAAPDWRRGGVGVAIARRVAALHGGTLVADCAPGRGLRAVASIPLGVSEGVELRDPGAAWDPGGFDEELIALSDLLPARAFKPNLK